MLIVGLIVCKQASYTTALTIMGMHKMHLYDKSIDLIIHVQFKIIQYSGKGS